MIVSLKRPLLILLVCTFCILTTKTAKADIGYAPDRKAVPIIIGVVAIGVLIVYFAVHHHGHLLKGCVSTGKNGMQILNEGDQQNYLLSGDLDAIHAGDRVRVKGKKTKKVTGTERQFVVTKLSKDYGPCHSPS